MLKKQLCIVFGSPSQLIEFCIFLFIFNVKLKTQTYFSILDELGFGEKKDFWRREIIVQLYNISS